MYTRYTKYPNSQKASDYSESRAFGALYLNAFSIFGAIGAGGYFLYGSVTLFLKAEILHFICSTMLFVAASAIILLSKIYEMKTEKECYIIILEEKKSQLSDEKIATLINDLNNTYINDVKNFCKKFYVNFSFGLIFFICISGIATSIFLIDNNNSKWMVLILSSIGAIVNLVVFLLYRKSNKFKNMVNQQVELYGNSIERGNAIAEKKGENENPTPEFNFCHKCGTKLLADSEYCSKCGSRIR